VLRRSGATLERWLGPNETLRVTCASSPQPIRILDQEIGARRFRQDLLYRLNEIPFLTSRLAAIEEKIFRRSARYFVSESDSPIGNENAGAERFGYGNPAAYSLAGKMVRELRNLVERLVMVCPPAAHWSRTLAAGTLRAAWPKPEHPYPLCMKAGSAYVARSILRKLQESPAGT